MPGSFMRDSAGRVTSYSFKNAPSLKRVRDVVHKAEKAGAKKAGISAQVGEFQGYEMDESESRILRAYNGKTPAGLLATLKGQGSNPSDYAILRALQNASGAEKVGDLRGATINFYYGA